MAEIWFYHLQRQPLERALPALVTKALARGWRVAIQTVDEARARALDDLLWTFEAASFVPHATAADPSAERQPVLICWDDGNPNAAAVRLYVDGAAFDAGGTDAYKRVILLFDGNDDAALAAARRHWSQLKGAGASLAYWQQDERGAWAQRG